jgi:hypothetical protein
MNLYLEQQFRVLSPKSQNSSLIVVAHSNIDISAATGSRAVLV